ncbi:MAG: hypothetical protein WC943_08485 [Elusimicrobiota bacterium]|jgi:hypothetical protein
MRAREAFLLSCALSLAQAAWAASKPPAPAKAKAAAPAKAEDPYFSNADQAFCMKKAGGKETDPVFPACKATRVFVQKTLKEGPGSAVMLKGFKWDYVRGDKEHDVCTAYLARVAYYFPFLEDYYAGVQEDAIYRRLAEKVAKAVADSPRKKKNSPLSAEQIKGLVTNFRSLKLTEAEKKIGREMDENLDKYHEEVVGEIMAADPGLGEDHDLTPEDAGRLEAMMEGHRIDVFKAAAARYGLRIEQLRDISFRFDDQE